MREIGEDHEIVMRKYGILKLINRVRENAHKRMEAKRRMLDKGGEDQEEKKVVVHKVIKKRRPKREVEV